MFCDGVYWYAYDNGGHRTERYQWIDADGDGKADREEKFDRTQYIWDARGRLVKIVTKPDGQTKSRVVHYDYDYQNRRVEKIVNDFDSDGEKTKTVERYLYTGQDIVLQTDRRGEVTHRYLHGPAVDQCLADERVLDDNILYPLFDNLGTIRDIADHDPTTGQTVIANHIVYSCYGVIISQTNPTQSTLYGLAGREIDPESDLYHLRGRYYDAALQQFLSEDPMGFAAGDPNPRRYCGNSPVNATDPSGLAQYTDIAQKALKLLGDDPKNISWDVVSKLERLGLATTNLVIVSKFWGTRELKSVIKLTRTDGGTDVVVVQSVTSYLPFGQNHWEQVGEIRRGADPRMIDAAIEAGERRKLADIKQAREICIQAQTIMFSALMIGSIVGDAVAGGMHAASDGIGKEPQFPDGLGEAPDFPAPDVQQPNALHRVIEQDRPMFQLNKGEEGISVFDADKVNPEDILPNFRPGSTVTTQQRTLIESFGLKVEQVEGDECLPELLRKNHFEIRPGDDMTRNQFKKALKALEAAINNAGS